MNTINIGPLSLPTSLALALLAIFVALWAGSRFDRMGAEANTQEASKPKNNTEKILWRMLIVGVLAGRLRFIASNFDGYPTSSWSFADLRDGGFSVVAGVAGAAIVALWYLWQRPAQRKPLTLAVLAGTAIFTIGTGAASLFQPAPTLLPNTRFATLDGQTVSLNEFHGKPTVVNLWATWCPPCQREMPALRDGQRENPDINFVFANQGEYAQVVTQYLSAHKLELNNVLLDPEGQLNQQIKGLGLPTTLFLNAQGQIADIRLGELSAATLQARLKALRKNEASLLRLKN